MKQNFWTWWFYKPTEEEMKKGWINELYIDIDSKWHHPKNSKELIDYVDLCLANEITPYIIVNCYAAADNMLKSIEQVKLEVKAKIDFIVDVLEAHPVLDYIRNSADVKVAKKDILELLDYAVERDSRAKSSIMSMWKSWYFNQDYSEFYKRITICPMVYGKGILTKLSIELHKLLYPKCFPCIRAWDTTIKEFCDQIGLFKDHKYTIWKWNDWKKL